MLLFRPKESKDMAYPEKQNLNIKKTTSCKSYFLKAYHALYMIKGEKTDSSGFWNSESGAWRKELMSSSWNQYGYQTWTSSSPTYWKADAESTITRNSISKVTATVTNAVTPQTPAAAAIAAATARERQQTTKKSCPRQIDQGIVSCKLTSTANLFFLFPLVICLILSFWSTDL